VGASVTSLVKKRSEETRYRLLYGGKSVGNMHGIGHVSRVPGLLCTGLLSYVYRK
jgi:hypothetical protein